jgi:Arc/MetJ family transcription regulator
MATYCNGHSIAGVHEDACAGHLMRSFWLRLRPIATGLSNTPKLTRLVYRANSPGGLVAMGRTNIEIDDGLIEKAMRLTGARTKREVVDLALHRLVDKGSLYRAVRRLRGNLKWQGDISAWRSARKTRT